jgi:hypothetical protein
MISEEDVRRIDADASSASAFGAFIGALVGASFGVLFIFAIFG